MQALRAWYSHINARFDQIGFIRSINKRMVYNKKQGKTDILLLCLYVDNILYGILRGNADGIQRHDNEDI